MLKLHFYAGDLLRLGDAELVVEPDGEAVSLGGQRVERAGVWFGQAWVSLTELRNTPSGRARMTLCVKAPREVYVRRLACQS